MDTKNQLQTTSVEQNARSLLKRFRPSIEHTGKVTYAWIFFLVLLILWGAYALYLQIKLGHGITGMRDHVVWGIYIVNFIFFIGISYGGAALSGILYLTKSSWRKPIMRIAKLTTIISVIVGPIYILLCVGRFDRLHYLFIYGRLQSPIFWDVVAITTYLVAAVLFLYLALIRDLALLRETPDLNVAPWRKKLYKVLALGYTNTPRQKILKRAKTLIAILIIPMAVIVSSVLSWIFGMTLRPGWHSTVFGPYFVIASIYSGTGVIVMIMWYYRRFYRIEDILTKKHFNKMANIIVVIGAIYGYLAFSEIMTGYYGSEVWEMKLLHRLFDPAQYGWAFLLAHIFGILVPVLFLAIPKFRTVNSITFVAFLMVIAMWVKRYLIIVPTLETPLLPMQDIRPEYIKYSMTWVEWALTAGGMAAVLLFFTLIVKFVPIIPIWDHARDLAKQNVKIESENEE